MNKTLLRRLITMSLGVALAVGTGLAAGIVTEMASAPQAAQASSVGGPISRSEVLSRAQYWYVHRFDIPYSQTAYHPDQDGRNYRTDCSGFVSMAWHLSTSEWTGSLANVSTQISKSALQPGDVLNSAAEHVILFKRWINQSTGTFEYYAFGGYPIKIATETLTGGSDGLIDSHPASNYVALRYDNIVNSGGGTADYDGDGLTDLALYRPSNGTWWAYSSGTSQQIIGGAQYGGTSTDIPLAGDFDNDGRTELVLYRRDCVNGSSWWAKNAATGTQILGGLKYGGCGDIPVVGDFDGDGRSDIGLYRRDCANGSSWWVRGTATGNQIYAGLQYGGCADIPVVGDFNSDSMDDLALYRQDCANGSTWWVRSTATGNQIYAGLQYGGCADIPAPGDYDGDGRSDIALYRQDCANGSSWWVRSTATGNQIYAGLQYGGCADIPATSIKM